MLAGAELAAHASVSGFLGLVVAGLEVLHPAQVDGDLAAGADADDALLDQGLAQPGDAVVATRAWLFQLLEQLADRLVVRGRLQDIVVEVLGDEQVLADALVDGVGDLRPLGLVAFDEKAAALGLLEVPVGDDGEAVEARLEGIAQLLLIPGLQPAVCLAARGRPGSTLHGGDAALPRMPSGAQRLLERRVDAKHQRGGLGGGHHGPRPLAANALYGTAQSHIIQGFVAA